MGNFSFSHSVFQKACFPGASKGVIVWEWVNPLPDDKILGLPKLKAFADDKLNVTQNIKVVFHRIEKHCGKRRKCWLPAFSSFPTMFSEGFFSCRASKVVSRHCVVKS